MKYPLKLTTSSSFTSTCSALQFSKVLFDQYRHEIQIHRNNTSVLSLQANECFKCHSNPVCLLYVRDSRLNRLMFSENKTMTN